MSGVVCVCPIVTLRHVAVNVMGCFPQRTRVPVDGRILVEIIGYECVRYGIKRGTNRITDVVVFMRFGIAANRRRNDLVTRIVTERVVVAGNWTTGRVEGVV